MIQEHPHSTPFMSGNTSSFTVHEDWQDDIDDAVTAGIKSKMVISKILNKSSKRRNPSKDKENRYLSVQDPSNSSRNLSKINKSKSPKKHRKVAEMAQFFESVIKNKDNDQTNDKPAKVTYHTSRKLANAKPTPRKNVLKDVNRSKSPTYKLYDRVKLQKSNNSSEVNIIEYLIILLINFFFNLYLLI